MIDYLNKEDMPMLLGITAVVVILIIAAIWFVRHLYKTADARKIAGAIKNFSVAYEQDVICSDGMGGYYFVDYLILLPGRILALNLPKVDGFVFGADNIEFWTQVQNSKSTKFKNPLEQLKLFVKHAADQLKFDGIMARLLFDSRSEFPKGVPESALQMSNFAESMAAWAAEKPAGDATKIAWENLSALVAESREQYNKETGVG